MAALRRWTGALALLLGAAVLIPGAVEAQRPVTLVFSYPVGVAGPLNRLMTALVGDFNRSHPGIHVEPVFSGNYVQATAKAVTSALGGQPADVAVLDTPELFELLSQKLIIPLDRFVAASGGRAWLDDFYSRLLLNNEANGHVYSIPWQRSTPILYYNKDLFRRAGLNPNQPPRTWSDLVADAEKLTVRDASGHVTRWGVEAPVVDTSPWLIQGFFYEAGAKFFDPNGTWVKFNSPQTVRALHFILDLQDRYRVAPPGPSGKPFWDQVPTDFIQQRAAMIYSTTGIMTFIRKNAPFQWDAAFMPAGPAGYGAVTGGGSFYIFTHIPADHVAAAWTFVRWMTEAPQAARWSIGTGYVPIRKSEMSVPSFAAYLAKIPQALTATRQLKYAGEQMTVYDQSEVQQTLVTAVQEAQEHKLSAQAALDQAQRQATDLLARHR
jgi:sn-glycerol 3-phosphate transport system substrate-binding protein